MLARGIRPLFILLFSPPWAWDPSVQCTSYCMYPPGAAHFDDAGRMAALLATRYPKAVGIEVWNEPNLSFFWRSYPDPHAYVGLLKATYSAVKRANPAMPVVRGSFHEHSVQHPGTDQLPAGLPGRGLRAGRRFLDGRDRGPSLSVVHEQPPAGAQPLPGARGLHNFGDDGKPLWITEVGLTTTDPTSPVSEAEQAEAVVRQYRLLRSMPDVDMVLFHTLVEFGEGATDKETGYGIGAPGRQPQARVLRARPRMGQGRVVPVEFPLPAKVSFRTCSVGEAAGDGG